MSKYDILEYFNKSNITNKKIIKKKNNNLNYYTLSSIHTKPRMCIYKQIDELFNTFNNYKKFYLL